MQVCPKDNRVKIKYRQLWIQIYITIKIKFNISVVYSDFSIKKLIYKAAVNGDITISVSIVVEIFNIAFNLFL